MSVERWRFGDDPEPVLRVLGAGGVVAVPTESSYGLAVDPANPEAVRRVFQLKGRASDKPLPLVVASAEDLPPGCRLRPGLESALAELWPSALTLVLDLDPRQPLAAAAGHLTLAVRVPEHRRLRDLLTLTGPLTATSANRASERALIDPGEVSELLTGAAVPSLLVEDGRLPGGLPSTLVRVEADGWYLLRRGAVAEAVIEAAAGVPAGDAPTRSSTAFVENSADG